MCNELAIAVAEETEVDKRTAVRMYDRLWSNITRRRDEVLARGFRAMAPGMGGEVHGTTDRNLEFFPGLYWKSLATPEKKSLARSM